MLFRSFNIALSAICGFFFAVAWWIFVDGLSYCDVQPGNNAGPFYLFCPGVLCTIGLFLMCNLPTSMFAKEDTGDEIQTYQKIILIVAVMFKFAGIIVAVWCYAAKKGDRNTNAKRWRGISTIIQSVVITLVSFAWNFLYKDPNGF